MKNNLTNDLFCFVSIIDDGSFTKAAQTLNISASVLSKRITRLEKTLGVSLIKRTTRELFLTPAGHNYYKKISDIKNNMENIIHHIRTDQRYPKGKLRISAPHSFGQLCLVPALSAFMKLYPEIQIELLLGQPYSKLLKNNIDIGVFIKEMPDSCLIAKRIGTRKITVCASQQYFEITQKKIPQIPEDLREHNCLVYTDHSNNSKNQWHFKKTGKIISVKVEGNFSANSTQVLMQNAIAGMGIVKLPSYMVSKALKEKKLVSLLEEYCACDIGIFAAYPFTRHPSASVKLLVDFLSRQFI